jgi:dipeptidyl aminopeptidase/acylaminoacyl peptidase
MDRVTSATYRSLTQLFDPRVSPDGATVALVERIPADGRTYARRLSLVDIETGDRTPLTENTGTCGTPRWSPAGDELAFVTDRYGETADLALCSVPDGDCRRLTAVAGPVSDPSWSPDGRTLAFVQSVAPEERDADQDRALDEGFEREAPDPRVVDRLVYRSDGEYFDGRYDHLYLFDRESGTVTRLTAGAFDVRSPVWLDSETVCYAAKRGDDPESDISFAVETIRVDTGETETLATDSDWVPTVRTAADGRIAWPRTTPDRPSLRQTDVVVYDPETGERTTPLSGLDRTLERHRQLCWDRTSLYACVPDRGDVVLYRVDVGGRRDQLFPDGHVHSFHAAGGTVAAVRSSWDHPGDLYVDDGGEPRRLTAVNEGVLDTRAVGRPEEVWFERDGERIQGWILRPPDADPSEECPLLVNVHGGPHMMWTTAGRMWHEFQTLAAVGYAVFWCNPRGSTGYGAAFRGATDRDWGEVTMRDLLAGVDAVTDRPGVDGDEVFVTGGSFGGYMTGWLVAHTDRFRGAVAQRGLYDLIGYYGSTDGVHRIIEDEFETVPWEDHDFLWNHSVVSHAPDVETPTLILHSENDYRTPICTAELFFRALKKNGVDTRLVRYPRESHDLSRNGEPDHVVDRLDRIVDWFETYRTDRTT